MSTTVTMPCYCCGKATEVVLDESMFRQPEWSSESIPKRFEVKILLCPECEKARSEGK